MFKFQSSIQTLKSYLRSNTVERQPPRDWDPLVKQTYSVWVETTKGRRKWHLSAQPHQASTITVFLTIFTPFTAAYFTQATIDQLGTIDDITRVRDVDVPEGMFKSTRVSKARSRTEDQSRSDVARAATSVSRTYAPFPTPYRYQAQNGSPNTTPVLMHEPYQTSHSNEQHPSQYEPSPSPVSTPLQGQYLPSHSQSSYHSTGSSTFGSSYNGNGDSQRPMSSSSQSSNYQLPSLHHHNESHPYYSSSSLSSSWNNNSSHPYYGAPSSQRTSPHISSSSSSSSSTYHHHTSTSHTTHSPYSYSPPIPPISPVHNNGGNHLYVPPYSSSLNSALVPLASPHHSDADRSAPLSPLQIPDRPYHGHSHVSQTQGSPTSPAGTAPGDAAPEMALAPLNILKRPIRYRREPADEKTLRLLRAPRSSP